MLKDAGLTALVAAGARHLHGRLPHRRRRRARPDASTTSSSISRIAVVDDLLRPARPVAGGRSAWRWPALALGAVAGRDRRVAAQAAVDLPALVRGAGAALLVVLRARSGRGRTMRVAVARPRRRAADRRRAGRAPKWFGAGRCWSLAVVHAVHAVRRPEDDGPRRPDPDLRHAGLGPEHRGRPRRPARSRLCRLLRRRRLFLRAAQHAVSAWASGRCCRSPACWRRRFGVLLGFPVLRLRGDYLAIVTLGFGEIIRVVLLNWVDLTNGPDRHRRHPAARRFFGLVFARDRAGRQADRSPRCLGIAVRRQPAR